MGLRESYGALPAEGQQFLREKQIDANWWPDAWLGFLGQLADYDARADAKRKTTGWLVFWAIFIGIGLTVLAALISPIAGVVVAVLVIALVIFLIVRWRSMRKTDLPGENLRFAKTLVTVLREDIAPGAGLRLRLDLRGPLHGAKQVHKSPEYSRGAYHKIVDTIYDDPWFDGAAELADECRLTWQIFDRTRSSKRTKRNPRGKIKTKVKNKKTTYFNVALSMPAKNYAVHGQGAGAGDTATKVKVKPAQSRTTVKVANTAKTADATAVPDPQHVVTLIADAYRRGNPTRRKKL